MRGGPVLSGRRMVCIMSFILVVLKMEAHSMLYPSPSLSLYEVDVVS
jgi:hypothetical protein